MSPDNKYLFSAGCDGSLFIYSVSEQVYVVDRNGSIINAGGALYPAVVSDQEGLLIEDMNNNKSIVDEELADIVLVRK